MTLSERFRYRADEIRRAEVDRRRAHLETLPPRARIAVEETVDHLVDALLEEPLRALDEAERARDAETVRRAAALLRLDDEEDPKGEPR